MSKQRRKTVYYHFVRTKLWSWCCRKGRAFTVNEFANFAGLKVTGNLRRQLHRAVDEGVLKYDQAAIVSSAPQMQFMFAKQWMRDAGRK